MKFFELAGHAALGSRLRHLGEQFLSDAKQIYKLYGVDIDSRWFPVFYMLSTKSDATITELAEDVGQTHPAVSQVVREMVKADLVAINKCANDGRVTRVALTNQGQAISDQLIIQCQDVEDAVKSLLNTAGVDLWSALAVVEEELSQQSFFQRVKAIRKSRISHQISIVSFKPEHANDFKQLNETWIAKHWQLEASDHQILDNPQGYVIDKGGYIAIALDNEIVIGCCALIPMDSNCMELAKMAVSDNTKGRGIGYALGQHVIKQAKIMGAKRVYLESNTLLEPAINLYRKLGFKRVVGQPSPYARCNIQMEISGLDSIDV